MEALFETLRDPGFRALSLVAMVLVLFGVGVVFGLLYATGNLHF